jgi:hypothetical protein
LGEGERTDPIGEAKRVYDIEHCIVQNISISKQCKGVISNHGRCPRRSVPHRHDLSLHEKHLLRVVKEGNTELDECIPLPALSPNESSSSG